MYYFILILLNVMGKLAGQLDTLQNKLKFGYGVNFKYNGKLYHNLDRVWVVHRVSLPSLKQLEGLPQFPQDLDCTLPIVENYIPNSKEVQNKKQFIHSLCLSTVPNFKLLQKQSKYFRNLAKTLIKHDLYHALHGLSPVSVSRYTKRALPQNKALLANASLQYPRPRSTYRKRRFIAALGAALLPAAGKLVTIAVEELGGYLQRKRNKALTKALEQLDIRVTLTHNMMHQLEKDFLLFGEYELNSTESIIKTFQSLDSRTSTLEQWLLGEDMTMLQGYLTHLHGPTLYSHQLQLYLNSLQEKYIRLYETLVIELQALLKSISILSRGYLPADLFPPSTLKQMSDQAINMIKGQNPDYVLALPHLTDYYDMRLVTFSLDEEDRLIICFPIFIKEHKREPMVLYQIETVKVPIQDKNDLANSYTEMEISKPYIASNEEYYIQLVTPELVMCKRVRHTYFCEELFLVKHKTKHSCESALFYDLPKDVLMQNCQVNYYYNTTVQPSVLDGGSQIVLANMLPDKRLICSHAQGLATPLPTSQYALVSRDILCHCHVQAGLTYLLKSIATCNISQVPVLHYQVNLAFWDYFHNLWNNTLTRELTTVEPVFPLALEDFSKDPILPYYKANSTTTPTTLHDLQIITQQKALFLKNRKKLFSDQQGGLTPKLPDFKTKSKASFLFTAISHIYVFIGSTVGICLLIPQIIYLIKHRKLAGVVTTLTLYRPPAVEAYPYNRTQQMQLSVMDIPNNPSAKMICQDPWVSILMTIITVVGIVVYLYRTCKHMTLMRGHKFASICELYVILSNTTRYVTLQIGKSVGSPFLFTYSHIIPKKKITLQKQILWDHVHLEWSNERITYKDSPSPVKEHVTIPLKDKIRIRNMFLSDFKVMYMAKQGDTWYNLTPTERDY